MKYRFEPHAQQELRDAVAYYDSLSVPLGHAFLTEVERVISLLRNFPEAWPELSPSTRRCRTRRFPYGLVYRIKELKLKLLQLCICIETRTTGWIVYDNETS